MAEEHKLDATFFAFKKRDKRFVLTRASAGYFILYAVLNAVFFALAWSSLGAIMGWYAEAIQAALQGGDMPAPPAEAFGVLPYAAVIWLLELVLLAAFEAACLRWLVRGESGGGFLGLTPGADTWRILAVYLMWCVLFVAFSIVVVLFYVLAGFIADLGGAGRILALLLGALAPLGFLALLIWGAVRFAPAAAVSVARGRFAFFAAPGVTRGIFWPLLGSFVILWVGYLAIAFVIGGAIQLPAEQAMAPVTRAILSGDTQDLATRMIGVMSSPVYLFSMGAYLIFSVVLSIVLYIALFGVNARAVLAAGEAQGGAA
jgi:hypothetical protein